MADEQHEWLDADAAEKLLRGDAVEPVGDHARAEARLLESALRALRTPVPPGTGPSGEDLALAAFREARPGGGRAAAAGAARPADHQDALHTVRIGEAPRVPRRRSRWTRPMRYGLAVSLAGCALGGVAVAGGTGMLPVPFGGHGTPVPASSVSAAASPEELGAEVPDAGPPSAPPAPTPPASSPPATPDPSGDPAAEPDGDVRGERDGGGAQGQEDGGRDSGTAGGGTKDGADGQLPGESAADVYKKSVQACRAHRDGTLSRSEKRRLLELAGGERNLDRFCDRVLAAEDDRGEENGGSGDGDGKGGDKDSDGNGSLPSITFRTESPDGSQESGTGAPPTTGSSVSPSAQLSSTTR
ncbi:MULTISPECIES: hypothetical protein [unclassified Streptomyces]|uniref:hypothetical protein n=1 Tax=unclassified Streptomyces TaxID=2593676 RepID=UPI0009400BF0|nr:hypothetical protein [Streptomyces sp. CB02058]OKI97802.1 hypothetical protein AMK10_02945 [Streptomyces sp. CB02058]